jgi:hypothetical protein
MRILSVLMVAGLLLSAGTAKALFSDDFNRADSVDVGNGWSEVGSMASVDPQIVGNEVSWGEYGIKRWNEECIHFEDL